MPGLFFIYMLACSTPSGSPAALGTHRTPGIEGPYNTGANRRRAELVNLIVAANRVRASGETPELALLNLQRVKLSA